MKSYKEFIQNILDTRGRFNCGDEYHERHHITPKCMGGLDDTENLIDLYAREHFIAHKLLAEENPSNDKLIYAWTMMSWAKRDDQYRYEVTPEEYEKARKALSLLSSKLGKERYSTPEKCPMFGKHLSEEAKQKISKKAKERLKNPEERKKMSDRAKNRSDEWYIKQRQSHIGLQVGDKNPMFGRKHTEESKRKNSESHKGMHTGEKHPMAKAVVCMETKQIYNTILTASNITNICEASIRKCCYGDIKTAGGYQWKFVYDTVRKNGTLIPGAITLGIISEKEIPPTVIRRKNMIKIEQTEDKELLEEILKQLEENDHFCPCHLTTTLDDKCMCKKFRDVINNNKPGVYECDCGRYIATITENTTK